MASIDLGLGGIFGGGSSIPIPDSEDITLGDLLSGAAGATAASQGAQKQAELSRQALQILRSNLSPFREAGIPAAVEALRLTDPLSQVAFLGQSPVFESLTNQRVRDITAAAASRGKLGAGGTAEDIQSSILQLGNQLINNQINRQLGLIGMGQAGAARQAVGSVDLLTGIGNAAAAGAVGAQNALSAGQQNIAGLGGTIFGAIQGGRGNTAQSTAVQSPGIQPTSATINTGTNFAGLA